MLRQARNAQGLPQHLVNLITRKYTFVVGLTSSSFNDMENRTYLVKRIAFDFHEQSYIASRSIMTANPQQPDQSSASLSLTQNVVQPAQQQTEPQVIANVAPPTATSVCTSLLHKSTYAVAEFQKLIPKVQSYFSRHLHRILVLMIHRKSNLMPHRF